MNAKRILYVEGNVDGTVGGSYYVLYDLVINLDKHRFCPVVLFYVDNIIASRLREKGFETYILKRPTSFVFPLKNSITPLGRLLYQGLKPLQRLINIVKRLLIPAFQLKRFIKGKNIDLINLNNSITRNHEWMLAAKLAGVDCMTHEMGINDYFCKVSRFFAARMRVIITVSEQVKKNMEHHGINYPHVIPIHNGIDLSRYRIHKSVEEIRNQLNITSEAHIIGVVGNIKYWKGQETVIKATAILRNKYQDICCLLVGGVSPTDQEYYLKLKQLTEQLKIGDNVIFAGFQENPFDFMNTMDVVIHSSVDPEPFGIVNLEAMYLRKPIISTTIGAPPEIFEHNISGVLVDPGNPETLARECRLLLDSRKKAQELGEAAYQRLMKNFTIDINVRKTESIYQQLLFEQKQPVAI